jgi:hypothetical protein
MSRTGIFSPLSPTSTHDLLVSEVVRRLRPDAPAATLSRGQAPRTDAELASYLLATFGVRLPAKSCCAQHQTPFRAFADAFFARSSVGVWEASRGFGGKSFMLALLAVTEAAVLGARVNVLGGSGEQAQRILEAMDQFWMAPNAPRALLASEPAKRETRLARGNWIRALMASTRSARGPHPQRLRMDEVDEMDLTILDAAMGQTMSIAGIPAQTVLSSTHQYADGTMAEVKKRAGEKGWPIYTWCYRECLEPHGWLAQAEVARKQSEVTLGMWNAEYELQEPSPEGRAIASSAVETMFDPSLGTFLGGDGQEVVIEPPDPKGMYATGADWARSKDWTVLWTDRIDVTPTRLVAFLRMHRLPWPEMVGKFDARVKSYPGPAAHDATGIGDVIHGYSKCGAEGVVLRGRERDELFAGHIQSIEHGERTAPRIDFAYGEHKYVTNDDLYGAGHPPDSFVAGALARRAAAQRRRVRVW